MVASDSLTTIKKAEADVVVEGTYRRFLNERGIVDESAVKLMRFFEGLAGAQHAFAFRGKPIK